jgi:quercetin dioxygenase-like cupin family protein
MPVIRGRDLDFGELVGRVSANPLPPGAAEECSVRVVHVPPGPRTPHRHPYSCEVVYVAAGEGRVWEGDDPSPVVAGDLVVVPPGVPHATICTGRSELVLVCFFPHPDLSRNLEELPGPVRR